MFNSSARNALNAYNKVEVATSVESASPHQLTLMLYDGALQEIRKARLAIEAKDVGEKCRAISHAMNIIQDGLQLSLDVKAGGEIGQNLNDLYDYMCNRLLIANLKNDVEPLEEVNHLLDALRSAWAEIGKKPVVQQITDNAPPPRNESMSYGSV